MKRPESVRWAILLLCWIYLAALPNGALAEGWPEALPAFSANDAFLVADPRGTILAAHNAQTPFTPASTLKILTGLTALHHFGADYRFKTEFFLDSQGNLKVKGYGDPLLISEVWQEIARDLRPKLEGVGDILVDDTYFCAQIRIPGRGTSTNPYDAPVGALSANFNTVFYAYDGSGRIISAEPQTPITPLARSKIPALGTRPGRYTFLRKDDEPARYAGELLAHFLRETGTTVTGKIHPGRVGATDRLIHTYRSRFTLSEAVGKMLAYSNNFTANQILVSLGAARCGEPGTLDKGVSVLRRYCRNVLGTNGVQLVEGSGISRENQLTALDMLAVLKAFSDYRHLLTRQGNIHYKSGTLRGIQTRAGYFEPPGKDPHPFVISLKDSRLDIDRVMNTLAASLCHEPPTSR